MRHRRSLIPAIAMLGLLLPAAAARADSCRVEATGIAFGLYDVFDAAPADSVGSITYECNGGGKPITIALGVRSGRGASYAQPVLDNGVDQLYYNLYLDAARTVVWGDGRSGTQVYVDSDWSKKTPVTIPVFGRIPPGQDVSEGQYTDVVTVTVNF
jgi:spore coat protein U-like protein